MKTSIVIAGVALGLVNASTINLHPRATNSFTCLAKGYDAGQDSFFQFTSQNVGGEVNAITFARCSHWCDEYQNNYKGYPSCVSFAWDPNAHTCDLYGVPLSSNFVPDDSSTILFGEPGCLQQEQECGIAGYSILVGEGYSRNIDAATCADWCHGDVFSSSWTYNPQTRECNIYGEIVKLNVTPDPSSPNLFYDAGCPDTSYSAVTTTTTTTTTAKRTTTTNKPSATTSTKSSTLTTSSTTKMAATTSARSSTTTLSSTKSTSTSASTMKLSSKTTSNFTTSTSSPTFTATSTTTLQLCYG